MSDKSRRAKTRILLQKLTLVRFLAIAELASGQQGCAGGPVSLPGPSQASSKPLSVWWVPH